jgi:hypothetical protein
VRRVVSIGNNERGVTVSKAGRTVQFESWQERKLLLVLDRAPDVLDYASQPERFQWVDNLGKQRSYVPDFIVWRRTGPVEIHEVTLAERRSRATIREREAAAHAICLERGWTYLVHTEADLPQPTEVANLLALFFYRPTIYYDANVTQAAVRALSDGSHLTLGDLITAIMNQVDVPRPDAVATLCHLLWHGSITTDLTAFLFPKAVLARHALVQLG